MKLEREWMGVYGWLTRIFSIKIKSIFEICGEDFLHDHHDPWWSSRSQILFESFCSLSLITDSPSTAVAANCHWKNRKLFEIDRMRRKQEWLTVLHDQFSLFCFHQWPRHCHFWTRQFVDEHFSPHLMINFALSFIHRWFKPQLKLTTSNTKMTIGAYQQQQILMQNSRNIFAPSQSHHLTDTKGLLNGPGQNNCFLNCAVQVSLVYYFHWNVLLEFSWKSCKKTSEWVKNSHMLMNWKFNIMVWLILIFCGSFIAIAVANLIIRHGKMISLLIYLLIYYLFRINFILPHLLTLVLFMVKFTLFFATSCICIDRRQFLA